jgi:hypothetical protein
MPIRSLAPALPAIAAALLPKCPLCLLAITSAIGVPMVPIWPLRIFLLALAIAAFVLLRRRRCHAPSCTVSMETEPPSMPSTGNDTSSPGMRAPRT